jgi:chemotaxis protein MotA
MGGTEATEPVMKAIIGILMVIGCVLGGYAAMGGKLKVLWQPFEVVIIVGAAIGAFVIANPGVVLKKALKGFGATFKGPKIKKAHYLEALTLQYQIFKLMKTKGILVIEQHIENPHDSSLFQQFPHFHHDHHAVEFLCDYLRMVSLGSDNPHVMEDIMNAELEVHHQEEHKTSAAIQGMADGMPALGIVAAVLGVIKTMGSINEPPAVLGKLIGGALVGTFLGVWIAYGFLGPIASYVGSITESDGRYLECLKKGILAYLQGLPPAVAVESARKSLPEHLRPTFKELEQAIEQLPPVK